MPPWRVHGFIPVRRRNAPLARSGPGPFSTPIRGAVGAETVALSTGAGGRKGGATTSCAVRGGGGTASLNLTGAGGGRTSVTVLLAACCSLPSEYRQERTNLFLIVRVWLPGQEIGWLERKRNVFLVAN